MPEKQRQECLKLLREYDYIFCSDRRKLKRASLDPLRLELKDNAVRRKAKPYRLSTKQEETVRKNVQELFDGGHIQHSNSDFTSSVFLVPKKDGTERMVTDYRFLNSQLKHDHYPLSNIADNIAKLSGSKYFAAFDMAFGYEQIEVERNSRWLTSFVIPDAQYEHCTAPYGITTLPAHFSRCMNTALQGLLGNGAVVYLDDCILHSPTADGLVKLIKQYFEKCRLYGLQLKAKKCYIGAKEIAYLGHFIGENGLRADPSKVESIKGMPFPPNAKLMKTFVAKLAFHQDMLRDFSNRIRLLRELAKLTNDDEYKAAITPEHIKVHQEMIDALVNAPILSLYKPNCDLILTADASGYALGAELLQVEVDDKGNKVEKPIAYYSRVLTGPETRYHTTERECLAIIEAIKKFHCYLHGRKFTIKTDHCALKYLNTLKIRNSRLARWALLLSEHQFEIIHVKGNECTADCASRLPLLRKELKIEEDDRFDRLPRLFEEFAVNEYKCQFDIRKLQAKDDFCREKIREIMENNISNEASFDLIGFALIDNILVKRCHFKTVQGKETLYAIVVPADAQQQVVNIFHRQGHIGRDKLYATMRLHFWFPRMYELVKQTVGSCQKCAEKKEKRIRKIPYQSYEDIIPDPNSPPFTHAAIDILHLPTAQHRFKYILGVICIHTRFALAIPLTNDRATTIVEALESHLIAPFGSPQQIVSDNGTNFRSSLYRDFCELLEIEPRFILAYRSNANGQIERFFGTFKSMLFFYADEKKGSWPRYVAIAVAIYNHTVHSATGFAPYTLVTGCKPRSILEMKLELPTAFNNMSPETERLEEVKILRDTAVKNLIEQTQKSTARLNRDRRNYDYKVGDKVYILRAPKSRPGDRFTYKPYDGPFEIIRQRNEFVYTVRHETWPEGREQDYHCERFKPYLSTTNSPEVMIEELIENDKENV